MSILTYCIFQKPKIIHKVKKILKKTVYIILYCWDLYFQYMMILRGDGLFRAVHWLFYWECIYP